MSEQTNIAWCDSTLNFWEGCTKVSDGCKNCYAEARDKRFTGGKLWGKGAPRRKSKSAVKDAFKLNRKPWVCEECGESFHERVMLHGCVGKAGVITPPNRWHRRRIFSLSLGDWPDPEVPIEWLAEMLDTIRQCSNVDFLLCTKRPELCRHRLMEAFASTESDALKTWLNGWLCGTGIPGNIVLLTSVENQAMADKRIPELIRIPAWRRGLSCEPLLGPVEFGRWLKPNLGVDWVIIGGESGKNARPCNVEWIRSLKEQCKAADVPCFVKQLGARYEDPANGEGGALVNPDESIVGKIRKLKDPKGGEMAEWPEDLRVREFYKP